MLIIMAEGPILGAKKYVSVVFNTLAETVIIKSSFSFPSPIKILWETESKRVIGIMAHKIIMYDEMLSTP